jgi:hypothetical protein
MRRRISIASLVTTRRGSSVSLASPGLASSASICRLGSGWYLRIHAPCYRRIGFAGKLLRTPTTSTPGCCAAAESDAARSPPAILPMNVRRSITERLLLAAGIDSARREQVAKTLDRAGAYDDRLRLVVNERKQHTACAGRADETGAQRLCEILIAGRRLARPLSDGLRFNTGSCSAPPSAFRNTGCNYLSISHWRGKRHVIPPGLEPCAVVDLVSTKKKRGRQGGGCRAARSTVGTHE